MGYPREQLSECAYYLAVHQSHWPHSHARTFKATTHVPTIRFKVNFWADSKLYSSSVADLGLDSGQRPHLPSLTASSLISGLLLVDKKESNQ